MNTNKANSCRFVLFVDVDLANDGDRAILPPMPTPFEIFKEMLLTAGDALTRRGYALQDDSIHVRNGLYRFTKPAADGAAEIVDVQLLFYSGGGSSRFEVKHWRADRPDEKRKLGVWLRERGLATQADELGWWEFAAGPELEEALRDAMSGLEVMQNAE